MEHPEQQLRKRSSSYSDAQAQPRRHISQEADAKAMSQMEKLRALKAAKKKKQISPSKQLQLGSHLGESACDDEHTVAVAQLPASQHKGLPCRSNSKHKSIREMQVNNTPPRPRKSFSSFNEENALMPGLKLAHSVPMSPLVKSTLPHGSEHMRASTNTTTAGTTSDDTSASPTDSPANKTATDTTVEGTVPTNNAVVVLELEAEPAVAVAAVVDDAEMAMERDARLKGQYDGLPDGKLHLQCKHRDIYSKVSAELLPGCVCVGGVHPPPLSPLPPYAVIHDGRAIDPF